MNQRRFRRLSARECGGSDRIGSESRLQPGASTTILLAAVQLSDATSPRVIPGSAIEGRS
jgi:hypothetical protein